MKVIKGISCALAMIGASLSGSALADSYIFGNSEFNTSNGINITATSGDFFVPISDSGSWNSKNFTHAGGTNYIVGDCMVDCGSSDHINFNNYFIFDLSSISGTILSASLNLYSYTVSNDSLEYLLFDVTSPLSDVHAIGPNAAVYNDLMSGISYGSFVYNTSDSNLFRSITLNSAGINALNSAVGGDFGIGGTTISPVPEPEAYAMLLTGLGLLGFMARRRKGTVV